MKTSRIPRPTENAAIAAADRTRRPLPSLPTLFAGLVTAHAIGDRHGENLFGHAIARSGDKAVAQ